MMPSLIIIPLIFVLAQATYSNEYEIYNTLSDTQYVSNTSSSTKQSYRPGSLCDMTIANRSIAYFRSRIALKHPDLIHITIVFNGSHEYDYTPETFRPNKWVWTYRSPNGLHPFLYWNIDYRVLSFDLLSAKTLKMAPYVVFYVPDQCNITFGTPQTTQSIANAIRDATNGLLKSGHLKLPEYEDSYYCYLAKAPGLRDSISYKASVYFMFPISYINYNCCVIEYNYMLDNITAKCMDKQIKKWPECTLGPYIFGIIIFLYFPIVHFRIVSWIANDETVEPVESVLILDSSIQVIPENSEPDNANDEWLYLDGNTPYKFVDLLTHIWCGLNKTRPLFISRLRRLCFVIAVPVGIYVQLIVYYCTMESSVKLLVKHRTPLGFLSLLGDAQDRAYVFATVFGGPVGISVLYFVLGTLLLVVPRSTKQIYEDGTRPTRFCFKTPLGLSLTDIKRLAMVNKPTEPGYQNVITLYESGIYMLFAKDFWKWVLAIQVDRTFDLVNKSSFKLIKLSLVLLHVIFCILEIILCIFLYGLPLCMCTVVTLRGATRSLLEFRRYLMQFCQNSILRKIFIENHLVNIFLSACVSSVVTMFAYIICLIFIETFSFLSQVMVFCFVAVIVYPSVAFGYLFFFVVIIYYIFRRIREFGDGYMELLSDAVDISRNLEGQPNYITFYGDNMVISNVKVPHGTKGLQINTTTIEVAANVFNDTHNRPKFKLARNMYGIPKDLFYFLVKRHRPAHHQVLKIVFHIMLIIVLIGFTIDISDKYVTGPSSEISEVMHVIFIVAIGALPRVLEVTLTNTSASVKKEIELKRLEQSVLEYWNRIASNS